MKNTNNIIMQKLKKCIIPAAGFGTRFLPATKALPKEMFPINDKPVMQYLVEEAISAGCTDVIIITWRSKRAIEDHFDSNFELEERLDKAGKFEYLKTVKWLNNMANIVYVRQPYPKGDGDAILRAKNLIWDEPFLVLFWDDIIDNEVSAASQLLEAYEKTHSPVIATIEVPEKYVSSYGILEKWEKENENYYNVSKFFEKPKKGETSSRSAAIWKYILTPDIFNYLENPTAASKDGELRLADALEKMRQERDIYWVNIKGQRFDTGSKIGFIKACIHYWLKDPELTEELRNYINTFSE